MNRPNTCRIGATTAGSLSPTKRVRLPNYWTVEIPHQRCFSADGELFEGVGVPPNEQVNDSSPAAAAASPAFDSCVKRAMNHIMKT